MKLAISSFKATSMEVQALLIKKAMEYYGHQAILKSYISAMDLYNHLADGYLWIAVVNPSWIVGMASSCIMARDKGYIYATVEGIPYPVLSRNLNVRYVRFIANSKFTKEMLEKSGLNVVDVVHHAIDMDEMNRAKKLVPRIKKQFKRDFKDKVVFTYVGRDDHRKQLDRLMKAIDILNQKHHEDFVVLFHVELTRPNLFDRDNVYVVGEFGKEQHDRVMALLGASDYLVFPSVSEGFGVPVLESLAMGTPVIINRIPPLTEFTNDKIAIYYDYDNIEYWETTADQYFVMHMYDPEELAKAMERAIDIYKNHKDKYQEMRKKSVTHASNWDYKNVYRKWLKIYKWG